IRMTGWFEAFSVRRVNCGANFLNGASRYFSQSPSGSIVCRSLSRTLNPFFMGYLRSEHVTPGVAPSTGPAGVRAAGRRGAGAPPAETRLWIEEIAGVDAAGGQERAELP